MTKQDAPTTTDADHVAFETWHRSQFATKHDNGHPTRDKHNGKYDEKYNVPEEQTRWNAFRAGIAHEAARASSAAAQPGWVLVPIEPTPEQRNAPFVGVVEDQSVTRQVARREDVARVYRAMIAAAPPAPPAKPADTGEASNG